MRSKTSFCLVLTGILLLLGADLALAAKDGQIIQLAIGEESAIKDLTLLNKVKDLALGVLSWILAPVAGAFTTWKGWQMIGNAERGDKGPGILVFLCGIGMFALGRIVQEILNALQS
jgi:hypothetical protein